MTQNQSPWHPDNEVERLLCSLSGVVSARVVANPLGKLEEIHVLASPVLNPKQVVRNVESALSAGLGIVVDRRIVSVAQIRRDAVETKPETEPLPEPAGPDHVATSPAPLEPRLIFLRYDARNRSPGDAQCQVMLRRDADVFTGTGSGDPTVAGRVQAGARAVFSAVAAAFAADAVGLEDAAIVAAQGRSFVLIAARGFAGRDRFRLTGVAPLGHAPEEAAILASLQAMNRWIGYDA
ncbi:MAG: hypothetical protein L0271_10840 [Gemmatimonadetes bacterium]|nr:hypothetical protein [Gemmatimonadota bacterium]